MWRLQDVFHCISRFFAGLPSSGLLASFTGAECHTAQKKLGESGKEEERRGGEGSGVEGSKLGGSKALAKAARKGRGWRGEWREWKRRKTMHEDGERKKKSVVWREGERESFQSQFWNSALARKKGSARRKGGYHDDGGGWWFGLVVHVARRLTNHALQIAIKPIYTGVTERES